MEDYSATETDRIMFTTTYEYFGYAGAAFIKADQLMDSWNAPAYEPRPYNESETGL